MKKGECILYSVFSLLDSFAAAPDAKQVNTPRRPSLRSPVLFEQFEVGVFQAVHLTPRF